MVSREGAKTRRVVILILALVIAASAFAADAANIVVAQDGSGDYRTIQAALNSIPAGNTESRTILIRTAPTARK